MKLRHNSRLAAFLPIAAPLALVFTASFAQAAVRTWVGGNGNWTAGAAGGFDGTWTNTADNAVFSGSGGTVNITTAISANATVPNIAFTGSGYTLSATALQVVTLGTGAAISVTGGNIATIGNNVRISRAGNMTIDGTTATAGTLVVDTGGSLTTTNSYVLGTAGRNVTLQVTGGSVTSSATNGNIVLGNGATVTSTMTLDSGIVSTATTTNDTGISFRAGTSTFNLNGGILHTLSVAETVAGSSTFNFNGGTLRASGVNGGANGLMSLIDIANVRNGGAIIDSNNFNVTVAQLLSHSAIGGDNATDGGLEKKGAGSLTLTNSNTYTGVTKVSAGTLTLGHATNTILNTAAVNVSGGILNVANSDTVGAITLTSGTISGVNTLTGSSYDLQSGTVTAALGGGAAVNKSTSGIVNLGGTQIYTDATNVTAGTLNVTGTLGNTLLSVSNDAALGGEGSTAGNVVLATGSTLIFDATTTGANQYFKTTGSIDATAGGVKLQLSSTITSGTGIVIAEAAGGWAGSTLANFILQARGTTSFSGNQLLYDFAVGNLTWKGNAGSPTFWDLNTTQNWDNTGSPDIFLGGDNVTFDNSAANKAVAVQTPLTAGTLNFANTSGNDYTLSGAALAATSLSVTGGGKVSVSNAVTLSGAATVTTGTLQLGDGTNATGSISTPITNNAALVTDFGANNVTVANDISGSGSLTQAGTGIVTLTGTNSYGTTTIESGATLQIGSGGAVGSIGSGTITNDGTLIFNRNNSSVITVANTINGSGSLIKQGAGAMTLSSANGYTGTTTITHTTASGALIVTANGALGTTAGGTTVAPGTSLGFSGGIDYATTELVSGSGAGSAIITGALTVGQRGFIQSVSGNNTFRGNIELNANGVSRIGAQDGASLTLTGAITQATGITSATVLFRVGNNNGDFITLSNAGNSFGGDSQIFTNLTPSDTNFAGVRLGITDALPTDRTITALSNTAGTSSLDLNGFDQTLNGLGATTGVGILKVVNLNTSTASKLTLTPTVDKTTSTTITIIGGAGLGEINVVKDGAFTQTLAGTHTYTGTTTVNEGTLLINGITSSLTTVASGATLGGTGTVGAVTVLGGGTLAPGTSPGTLSVNGALSLGLSNLNFELTPGDFTVGGGINDLVSVTGNLTLDGILNLTPTSGNFLSVVSGTAWRLFNYSGSLTDNTLDFGTMPALGSGLSWNISTSTANQVNLLVIPEPSAALLGSLGLLALLRRRR